MKKALVTGCAGFIGSHLAERLIKDGFFVYGIDCLSDYYSIEIKKTNLKSLLKEKQFKFSQNSINDLNSFPDVDYIFHLAAQAGVRKSWGREFDKYTQNNIDATQRLLEWYKDKTIVKFVYASSSSVYGDSGLPMNEIANPRPISPYGVTKLAGEHLCILYWKNYQIPVVSLRYFTVYGPRQRPDMAISRFMNAMACNEKITIFGDGNQTRDFTYVHDIVDANLLAADLGKSGNIYNVGGGNRITVLNLVKMLENLSGCQASISFLPDQKGDVQDTLADTTKIKHNFHWSPETSIEEGLCSYIDWFTTYGQMNKKE